MLSAETLLDAPPPAEMPEQGLPDEQVSPYGQNNEKLPEQLVNAIRATIKNFQQQEKYTRRREVLADRKLRFYERGYQHISWNNSQGAFTLASPGCSIYNSAGQSIQCPTYIDDYDIFFPYLRIITSVLTQNPPGVNFQPIDPAIPEDIDKAKSAQDYSLAFDRMNDVKQLQTDIVRMFGLSGRCVSWTRTETDGQRFGYKPDGTPKTFQRTTIHGTLETKVPILNREFDRSCLYVLIYDDLDIQFAKAEYPEFAPKIKANQPALGESAYERTARMGILNGTRNQAQIGDSMDHMTARVNAFLRPEAFTGDLYDDEFEEAGPEDVNPETGVAMTAGDKLKQLFEDGCRAVFVGDTYVGSHAESMDDHVEIQWPYSGDGMFRRAFMEPMSVVQDNFNDLCNWIREKVDTGAGSLWINGEQEDVDSITSQRAAPNAIRAAKNFAQTGRAIGDSFFKEPDPEIPETLFKLLEFLRGALPEFILAALPSLQGGEMADNKTASGYAQANAQAKGQLGMIWGRVQRMFARIRYQAALAAANCADMQGQMVIPGSEGQESVTVNLDGLKKGNFGCYPDEDSSFPESTQQQRATVEKLIEAAATNPMIAQLLDNPDNIAEIQRIEGIPELVLLPAEARDKQLWEIEKLLQEDPSPPDPLALQAAMEQHASDSIAARHTGQPEPPVPTDESMMQSTIPVDELDYHQWEFQKCQEWLSSRARREQEKRGNLKGVLNVKLHALEHRKFMMAMAAQAAAMAPAPQPAPGKKEPPKPGAKQAAPPAPAAQAA